MAITVQGLQFHVFDVKKYFVGCIDTVDAHIQYNTADSIQMLMVTKRSGSLLMAKWETKDGDNTHCQWLGLGDIWPKNKI